LIYLEQSNRLSVHIPAADDQLHALNAMPTTHGVLDGHLKDVEAIEALAGKDRANSVAGDNFLANQIR
jgi:hypothetical protein